MHLLSIEAIGALVSALHTKAHDLLHVQQFDKAWHTLRFAYSIELSPIDKEIYQLQVSACPDHDDHDSTIAVDSATAENLPTHQVIVLRHHERLGGYSYEVFLDYCPNPVMQENAIAQVLHFMRSKNESFSGIRNLPSIYMPLVKQVKAQLYPEWAVILDVDLTSLWRRTKYDLNEVVRDAGISYQPLRSQDAKMVLEQWNYGQHEDLLPWIGKTIEKNINKGAYVKCNVDGEKEENEEEKKNKADEKLVGQVFTTVVGTFGGLYVANSMRGRGLAKVLMMLATNEALEKQIIPMVEIEKTNIPSMRLFRDSLHYECVSQCTCLLMSDTLKIDEIFSSYADH